MAVSIAVYRPRGEGGSGGEEEHPQTDREKTGHSFIGYNHRRTGEA